MRERYLELFDTIHIDSLNGDKYRTGKLTPGGLPDPSVFSTEANREGIQVGTAIATLIRKSDAPKNRVHFRDVWGKGKLGALDQTDFATLDAQYQEVTPVLEMGYPFMPSQSNEAYFSYPSIPELLPMSFPGVKTSRDDVVVDIERDNLVQRMSAYFNPDISHREMREISSKAVSDASRFKAKEVREYLQKRGFLVENVVRYSYRPFDTRWIYWEPETKLLDEKRADYFPHVSEKNPVLAAVQQNRKDFDPPLVSTNLCSLHVVERGANLFPLYLKQAEKNVQGSLYDNETSSQVECRANLSESAKAYLSEIGKPDGAETLFYHAIAVLHSPKYREENSSALRQDWPRIPLPKTKEGLEASAALGREVAALLDTEQDVAGVTSGSIREELRGIAQISAVDGGTLNPDAGDLGLRVNWGYSGSRGVTMPGRGKAVQREYTDEERSALAAGANALGLSLDEVLALLGATTFDVYLNERAYWRNVPERVWVYTIGGYQVMKKWLSYREEGVLGRALSTDEAREVRATARRVAGVLLLEAALDESYGAAGNPPGPL